MTTQREDGGQAFPRTAGQIEPDAAGVHWEQDGMTLRQWYAGMALASGRSAAQALAIADEMLAAERDESNG